jgi:hypothetical protein
MSVRATLLQTKIRGLLVSGAGITLAVVPSAPLLGQVVQISPIANFSLPTKFSLKDGTLHVSQKVGFRFGARMTLTFNNRFDVTNAVTYSPGYATLHGEGKRISLTSGSHTIAGSTAARYWIRPPGQPLSWEVHTGVGLVFGGQPYYMDLFESSTMNAVLGTAVTYQIGQIVSLTMRLQQRLMRLRFGEQNGGSSRKPLQVTFGVGLPLLERLR